MGERWCGENRALFAVGRKMTAAIPQYRLQSDKGCARMIIRHSRNSLEVERDRVALRRAMPYNAFIKYASVGKGAESLRGV